MKGGPCNIRIEAAGDLWRYEVVWEDGSRIYGRQCWTLRGARRWKARLERRVERAAEANR